MCVQGESLPLFVGGDVAAVVLAGMGPVAGINATAAGADAEPVPLFQTFGQNVAELATGNSSSALYVVSARQVPFDLMVSPSVLLLGTLSYKQVFKPC